MLRICDSGARMDPFAEGPFRPCQPAAVTARDLSRNRLVSAINYLDAGIAISTIYVALLLTSAPLPLYARHRNRHWLCRLTPLDSASIALITCCRIVLVYTEGRCLAMSQRRVTCVQFTISCLSKSGRTVLDLGGWIARAFNSCCLISSGNNNNPSS